MTNYSDFTLKKLWYMQRLPPNQSVLLRKKSSVSCPQKIIFNHETRSWSPDQKVSGVKWTLSITVHVCFSLLHKSEFINRTMIGWWRWLTDLWIFSLFVTFFCSFECRSQIWTVSCTICCVLFFRSWISFVIDLFVPFVRIDHILLCFLRMDWM